MQDDAIPALDRAGRNLFERCLELRAGGRLLIVAEPPAAGYYDAALPGAAAASARALGVEVETVEAPVTDAVGSVDPALLERITRADAVLFLARLGDQLRFAPAEGGGRRAMCYALDLDMLASAFGGADHRGLLALKTSIDRAVASAARVVVSCPLGTRLVGSARGEDAGGGDVSLRRFPMAVFRPVPAAGFAGRVALSRFLVGTGSRRYRPYALPLRSVVFAHVAGGRVQGFEGDRDEVARIEAHYADIAGRFDIDGGAVHSWHAGIHPGCAYRRRAEDDLERWGGAAFGNPRILHFHTCGAYAPGEICWNLFDATVELDGAALWEAGRLRPGRLDGGPALLAAWPDLAALVEAPAREIGL